MHNKLIFFQVCYVCQVMFLIFLSISKSDFFSLDFEWNLSLEKWYLNNAFRLSSRWQLEYVPLVRKETGHLSLTKIPTEICWGNLSRQEEISQWDVQKCHRLLRAATTKMHQRRTVTASDALLALKDWFLPLKIDVVLNKVQTF